MAHKNILLVEDEYRHIIRVQREFDKLDAHCTLHTVSNLDEAMEMLTGSDSGKLNGQPDIVLVNIDQPVSNGFGFLDGLRKDRKLKDIAIFVMSDSWEESDRNTAAEYGIKGCILKPLNFDIYSEKESSLDTFNLLMEILR